MSNIKEYSLQDTNSIDEYMTEQGTCYPILFWVAADNIQPGALYIEEHELSAVLKYEHSDEETRVMLLAAGDLTTV
jgi:hypothetical protein